MKYARILILTLTALGFAASDACGDENPSFQARFEQAVSPVLKRHCLKCHGRTEPENDLRLVDLDGLLTGGASGAVVQPGQPSESLLVHLVRPASEPHMPPRGQLSDREITEIQEWIRALPKDLQVGPPRRSAANHWGFRPPVRPEVPAVQNTNLVSSPIDAFILARLESDGLTLSPPASASQFVRRATLDLTGLPPNRHEVESFEREFQLGADRAVRSLLNRLLASPHYGERWGRYWLDLARYADSNGFEFDFERPHAWHYRDWVIDSLNADRPYDEFVAAQIAGDELDDASFSSHVATGFCRHGPTVGNQNLEKHRWDELDDVISTTSEVFLGLTLGCARCHDHKFDPITQDDYYSLLAIFNSTTKRSHFVGSASQRQERDRLNKELRERREQLKKIAKQPSAGDWALEGGELEQRSAAPDVRIVLDNSGWGDYTVEVEFQKTGGTEESLQYDASVSLMFRATDLNHFYWLRLGVSDNREHGLDIADGGHAPIARKIAGTLVTDRWYRLRVTVQGENLKAWLDHRLMFEMQHARYAKGGIGLGNWSATTRWRNLKVRDSSGRILLDGFPDLANTYSPEFIPMSATVDELNREIREIETELAKLPLAFSITDEGPKPRETRLLLRGDHRTPGHVVEPAVPAVLSESPVSFPPAMEGATTTGRRRVFANWLVSPDNPLTARVMVNRIWQYHFGEGLVDTPSNFGLRGSEPSHPQLLDWLAVEFVESGWSVKHIHRLIMSSEVYRQKSRGVVPVDANDRLLSSFPMRRLEAELIRDRVLFASGSLNRTMYGPGIRPRIHPSVVATSTTRKWPTVVRNGPEHWRRSIYVFVRRSVLMPMLESFDFPTTTQSCEKRVTTTVATQALQLMNDQFTEVQAELMAKRIVAETGDDVDRQIDDVYWRALSREPSRTDRSDCRAFLASQREFHKEDNARALADLCHVMFNLNEFVYVE